MPPYLVIGQSRGFRGRGASSQVFECVQRAIEQRRGRVVARFVPGTDCTEVAGPLPRLQLGVLAPFRGWHGILFDQLHTIETATLNLLRLLL